jgi:lysophospholipase L1-like esterase
MPTHASKTSCVVSVSLSRLHAPKLCSSFTIQSPEMLPRETEFTGILDHLHPNDNGYQAMANAINLTLF